MKYQINYSNPFLRDYNAKIFDDARDAADYIMEHAGEEPYDEMLDECYGEINICGIDYPASVALYRVDECAYRCGMNDYYDGIAADIAYELERMDDAEEQEHYDFTVTAIDDAAEDDDTVQPLTVTAYDTIPKAAHTATSKKTF